MPNELGLLTKVEAKNLRDIHLSQASEVIKEIAEKIKSYQNGDLRTELSFNKVVHDDVVKYFKNVVGYTVTDNKQGQPVNFTLLQIINWL